jgi:hypothetical protein
LAPLEKKIEALTHTAKNTSIFLNEFFAFYDARSNGDQRFFFGGWSFAKGINLSTLFKISIVGLYFF